MTKKSASNALRKIARLPPFDQQITLAALLSRLFREKGMDFILVGGATVQFYTQGEYQTKDIDIILRGDTKEDIEEIMHSLDFKRTTNYRHFENPLFAFSVEFPPSPIQVGRRTITKVSLIKTPEGPLEIIRIEDIIMDRIIAGVEWKDARSIDQAKLIWRKNKDMIDLDYLTDFSKKEGYWKTLQKVIET
ncbi:MAG TPA: hypothetical protein VFX30_00580 [bacterium]|nr:hypothetical protein [bacterium]